MGEAYRIGIVDEIETIQKIPDPVKQWSDASRWAPYEKCTNYQGMYIIETAVSSSPSHYHVAVFDGGQFRDYNDRRIIYTSIIRWKNVL